MKVLTILSSRTRLWIPFFAGFVGFLMLGCQHTPIDLSQGPASLRIPRPGKEGESFEDSLAGGEVLMTGRDAPGGDRAGEGVGDLASARVGFWQLGSQSDAPPPTLRR